VDDWHLEPAHDLGLAPAERARSLRRESGLVETIAHRVWWAGVRFYLRVYHGLRIEGRANVPRDAPFVLAANHASHLDALVLASAVSWRMRHRIFPIAAGDTFFASRVSAVFAAVVINALPMWRRGAGRHALGELRQRLVDEQCVYILFPEGTRSRDGAMGSFRAGIGMIVAGTNVPVVPCHLEGTFDALPPRAMWPRWKRVRLYAGKPITFASCANDREGWERVAREVEGASRELAVRA
jgi:1-acyl-sn-glycerol-3-phosphate acyltransferase